MTDPNNKLSLLREFFKHHSKHHEVHVCDGQCFYNASDAMNHAHGSKLDEKPVKWTRSAFEVAEKAATKSNDKPKEGEAEKTSPNTEKADAKLAKEAEEAEVVRNENPDLTDTENHGRTTKAKRKTSKK